MKIDVDILKGQTFEYWTIKDSFRKGGRIYCNVECGCGTSGTRRYESLKTGRTASCGCKKSENISYNRRTHGMSHTHLHNAWIRMKERCYYEGNNRYQYYGGKGIEVCNEWKDSFEAFMVWAFSNGYKQGLSIERKNVALDYSPENCCWIPVSQQAMNKSTSHLETINGETKNLLQWCQHYDIGYAKVMARLHYGWDILSALTLPKYSKKPVFDDR